MMISSGTSAQWPAPAKSGVRRSIVAADLIIEGDIDSTGPVDVEGKVLGQVRAPDILIAPTGILEGTAVAHDLAVHGRISGAINARNVSLTNTAVVLADIGHETIAIESGAEVEGKLERIR
ncbi:polymer-forming cytoskeletal protein [Pseudotabrizicola sediminis]|uniref:Polymer-forming cytoskeletal protein n=1 Tax=Pseudotabrizicola sediminis TaxID=2486418 RepID=A0ABY2KQC3_9RHOB|nr:polymer-forming cytoskeletal protein [Pseudotabrizicola sediminis]TGD44876.1 polymer-forming cytoskeletal protein [Pseudotabrizicola sediminis]TGD60477.1 polymer-forming cytoskeletal protein [Tabrizicola sp. WMC-M-20]